MRRFYTVRGGAGDVAEPDVNAKPQDNLYLAVNSNWLSKAEIPADRTSTGVNSELDIKIENRMMKDFADIAAGNLISRNWIRQLLCIRLLRILRRGMQKKQTLFKMTCKSYYH